MNMSGKGHQQQNLDRIYPTHLYYKFNMSFMTVISFFNVFISSVKLLFSFSKVTILLFKVSISDIACFNAEYNKGVTLL